MREKQQNERKSTRYEGVTQRESRVKRHKGKPDVCYSIDYRDPSTGVRKRRTVGWRSQGVTAEYASSVRNALLTEGRKQKFAGLVPDDDARQLTFAQAWALYRRDWLEARNLSCLTTDTGLYTHHLQAIAPKPLSHISAADLDAITAAVTRKGLSMQTARHTLALVKRVMRKMQAWKRYNGPLPFAELCMPKVNNQRQRYLTPYEAHALLSSLKALNPRMWRIATISLMCGLRFGEIAALRWADVNFEARMLFVRDPKGGRDRFAHMNDAVIEALSELPGRMPSELLFPTRTGTRLREKDDIFDEVVAAWEFNAGITDRRQKVVFHTLRHTYASWLARDGHGQGMIAEMLGHATLEMSRRYTHLMPDAKREAAESVQTIFRAAAHQEPPK